MNIPETPDSSKAKPHRFLKVRVDDLDMGKLGCLAKERGFEGLQEYVRHLITQKVTPKAKASERLAQGRSKA